MRFRLISSGVAALALLATSFTANAADIPPPIYKGVRSVVAYYNWTGFYAGINGGYAWGNSDWEIAGVNIASPEPNGFLIGGTLGYNFQTGSFVWGLEADIAYADIKGDTPCALGLLTCETKNTWLGTGRLRLGYAFDRFMPYITGGVAFGEVQANVPQLALTASNTQIGWTVGAGLEYAFLGNWTAKLEYLYVDLGSFDTGFTAPVAATNVDLQMHVVRAGLNYKFSGPIFTRW